jgi:hypothetical protein
MLLKEQYQVLVKSLLPYAQKELGFNKPPVINFLDDKDNSSNPLGKTGFYRPDDKSISVFITGRHPKDILRSVAHELVHYQQDCDGRLTQHMRKELHDKRYAQNNPDLRGFEEEAYLKGNMIFRDWEDNYKNQPLTIRINKQMNESKLRSYIKQLVNEIVTEEKKKKEEEQRADVSQVRDSAKSKELGKYKIAEEQDDTESVPLNEWKNQELFGLLSNRFIGRNLTETAKPDFLDLDKDGDKKEPMKKAAKEAKKDGSNEEEEEELDEAKLSKPETKEKEKIVKGMKPKKAEFEKRYPGRGEEVMYATATKMAKERK